MRCYSGTWRIGLLLALLVPGCDDGTGPEDEEVVIASATGSLRALVGDTVRLSAYRVDEDGKRLPDQQVSWTSSDTTIARIEPSGLLRARTAGVVRIRAAAAGSTGQVEFTVDPRTGTTTPNIVRLASGAPRLATDSVTFQAVSGEERVVNIEFLDAARTVFLTFRVQRESVRSGAVSITLKVDRTGLFRVELTPAGQTFDPAHPAELSLNYHYARQEDLARENGFTVLKQTEPNTPWVQVQTIRRPERDQVWSPITSFTSFALATN